MCYRPNIEAFAPVRACSSDRSGAEMPVGTSTYVVVPLIMKLMKLALVHDDAQPMVLSASACPSTFCQAFVRAEIFLLCDLAQPTSMQCMAARLEYIVTVVDRVLAYVGVVRSRYSLCGLSRSRAVPIESGSRVLFLDSHEGLASASRLRVVCSIIAALCEVTPLTMLSRLACPVHRAVTVQCCLGCV